MEKPETTPKPTARPNWPSSIPRTRTSTKSWPSSQQVLLRRSEIRHPELPFAVRIKNYFPNSVVQERSKDGAAPASATQGIGTQAVVRDVPHVTEMDRRDVPSAIIEIVTPQGSLGTWLVSEYINSPQQVSVGNRSFSIALRPRRFYKPYSIQLLEFRHDLYPGTEIPKNFSSRVRLQRPDNREEREVLIYMNNPLRYGGETYYQASFDTDNQGTILQVVHNPSWLTPYFSCVLVGLGLVVQFMTHLFGFARKRRKRMKKHPSEKRSHEAGSKNPPVVFCRPVRHGNRRRDAAEKGGRVSPPRVWATAGAARTAASSRSTPSPAMPCCRSAAPAMFPLEEVPSWKFWHHPKKLKSTEWLLEVMTRPEFADTRPIFPDPPSGTDQRTAACRTKGVEKSGLRYYTFNELKPVLDEID